jgi:phosphoesterase family protein
MASLRPFAALWYRARRSFADPPGAQDASTRLAGRAVAVLASAAILGYYRWAKTHNSLLIVTFDENDDKSGYKGLTDPAIGPDGDQRRRDLQNHIVTIFAGADVEPGHADAEPLTHVNILRTIEAIYGLPKAGAQPANAVRAGIADAQVAAGAFEKVK